MKRIQRTTLSRAVLLALSGLTVAGVAQAQTQQPQQQVEKIEVTGSNIKRVQAETATPVTVISREEIQKSGATSLNEVLQSVSVSGIGNFSETNTNLSSGGGSAAISLRGLGASYTLTLIDGRRVAPSGFGGATGVASFTDLNSIPLSAIDRIEVLRGSASAIYGADAVGGVINLILRRDYKGGEIGLTAGTTQRSDGEEIRANAAFGMGDMAKDRFNVLGSLDFYKREKIRSIDRTYGANADGRLLNADLGIDTRSLTGNPGSYRTGTVTNGVFTANSPWRAMPNCPTVDKSPEIPGASVDQYCTFNFLKFWDLVPPAERVGGVVKAEFQVTPEIRAFARLVANSNKTLFNVAPTPLPAGVILGTAPGNSLGQTYQYVYRITAGGPRVNDQKIDFYSALAGLQGTIGNYDWKLGFGTSETKNRNDGSGYVNTLKVAAASAAGLFKPYEFASNPALEKEAANAIVASYTRIGKAKSDGIDATISGDLMSLPGGALSFAAGAEFRKDSISDRCITPECSAGAGGTSVITGANTTAAGGKRSINAQYVELRAAPMKGLDLSAAARRDDYSGESDKDSVTGEVRKGKYDKVTPQISVEFRPMTQLLVRAVAGEGFKAPTLFEAYQATSESFNNGAAYRDIRRFSVTGAREDSGNVQVRNFRGGNPGLLPEESKNASVGFVFDVTKDLNLTLDHYVIDLENTIGLPSVSRLLAREAAAGGSPLVVRGPASATDIQRGIPGSILYLTLNYANLGQTRVQGTDLDVEYKYRTSAYGNFGARTVMTYFHTYKQAPEPGVELTEYLGTYNVPRFRASLTLSWAQGPWEIDWRSIYTGKHGQLYQNTAEDKVAPDHYHNLNVQYTGFKKFTLGFGVRNVFDREPSFANGDSQNYSYVFGDPRGRSYWASMRYKF